MNKTQVVEALAKQTKLSRAQSSSIVDALFSTDGGIIARALKKGDKVSITGFGTFDVRKRKARTGRNPRTGATIKVPATKVPGFRSGASLKKAVGRK